MSLHGKPIKAVPRGASRDSQSRLRWFADKLFVPMDNASLVFFRLAFGTIMLWEVLRYFDYGWIKHHWIDPRLYFKFYGFEWVHPWPGDGMYYHFVLLGVLAFFILVGLWYRAASILFFLAFTYVFLLDRTWYLNHLYLITTLSFLMIFIPAHRGLSMDVWLRPKLRASTAPTWTLWLLRFQIFIVYFYGGLAKVNADWIGGEPMRTWLADRTDFPLIGQFFSAEWAVASFSLGGLLLDLFAVPFLLWPRTRMYAFVITLGFHLTNAQLFNIGIFPWFMICATLMYFPPDWPRRVGLFVRQGSVKKPAKVRTKAKKKKAAPVPAGVSPATLKPWEPAIGRAAALALLALFVAYQLLMPLRHWFYPGNASWTSEGDLFSWRMKLNNKRGTLKVHVTDPATGKTWEENPARYLSDPQHNKLVVDAELMRQFSHFLANDLEKRGRGRVEVRADLTVGLNGREPQLLINPSVDLASEPRRFGPAPWILPMKEPPARGRLQDQSADPPET